jgi:hypothetical protein
LFVAKKSSSWILDKHLTYHVISFVVGGWRSDTDDEEEDDEYKYKSYAVRIAEAEMEEDITNSEGNPSRKRKFT